MENYEDMIACSPASSEIEEGGDMFSSQSVEADLGEEEMMMSQFEEDSLRSLMGQAYPVGEGNSSCGGAGEGTSRRHRMDKMSIRKFCTREGDQAHRCNICSKSYTHISNFCRHFLSAHAGAKQEVHCPVCNKPFTRKDNMMTHAKQVHGYPCIKNMLTEPSTPFDQQATDWY